MVNIWLLLCNYSLFPSPYENTYDVEYREYLPALWLTELWIVSIYLTGSILNKEKRGLKPDLCLCMYNLPRRKHIKNFLSYIYFEKSNNLKKTSLKHKEKSFTKKSDQNALCGYIGKTS